jgi:hypothetical protein
VFGEMKTNSEISASGTAPKPTQGLTLPNKITDNKFAHGANEACNKENG